MGSFQWIMSASFLRRETNATSVERGGRENGRKGEGNQEQAVRGTGHILWEMVSLGKKLDVILSENQILAWLGTKMQHSLTCVYRASLHLCGIQAALGRQGKKWSCVGGSCHSVLTGFPVSVSQLMNALFKLQFGAPRQDYN